MEAGLAPVEIAHRFAVEEGVFFLAEVELLAVPFGHGNAGVEFDRPGGVGANRVFAARVGGLIVPEADAATRAVAVEADRMGVDGGLETLRNGLAAGGGEDLIAGEASAVTEVSVCKTN